MAQITADFDFAYFAYDFEEDFAFEPDSYIHRRGDFPSWQFVACNSSGPNRTNSHDGNRNCIYPHSTLWSERDHDDSNLYANPAIPTVSSTTQPRASTVNQSTTHLPEEWPSNSNSFLHKQRMTDYATHVRPHISERNVESALSIPGEKLCTKCRGTAGQEATTPTGIAPSSPSSAFDSTTCEGPTPLSCKLPTCKRWNKPFKTKGDFDRHQLIHRPPKFKCPKADCGRSRTGFPRKDKLISHLERGHHESKQKAKMLVCEQGQATNGAMMEGGLGSDFEASIYALDWYDPQSS